MKIHLYASFGNFSQLPKGGGQTSARRLKILLESLGYDVRITNRLTPKCQISLLCNLFKFLSFLIDPIRYAMHLFMQKRNDSYAMVVGYSGFLFPFYFSFIEIAKCLGFQTVFYIKGGFTKDRFNKFNLFTRHSFVIGLKFTDILLSEGEEGLRIAEEHNSEVRSLYLPNFLESSFCLDSCPTKPKDKFNFVYFGRISSSKNVTIVVDVFNIIAARFENVSLTIIGSGEIEYEKIVEERINNSRFNSKIIRISRINHEKLKEILVPQHFMIFPSSELQEGHSNALTEAMGIGVVPIVNNNNFLPAIVGDDSLIAKEMKAEAYAEIIERVINDGIFEDLSLRMFNRVRSNFTQHVIENKIKNVFEKR